MKRFVLWLAPLSLALVGCGGSIGNFVGTWNVTSGSMVVTCGGQSQTLQAGGNDTIVEGTDSDIVLTQNGCNQKFNVDGNVATLVPGQTCTSNGVTLTWTTGTITLGGDEKSYTVSETLTLSDASGTSCTGNGSYAAVKVGN